jgi:hypothetical protein
MIKKYWPFIKESHDREQIRIMCSLYEINNYTINGDGTIDVDGYVNLTGQSISRNSAVNHHFPNLVVDRLPIKFGTVTGSFYCSDNKLTTLDGSPHTVGGNFDCRGNNLTSLKGGPNSVGGDYDMSKNNITTFEGFPELHSNIINISMVKNPVQVIYELFNDYVGGMWEVFGVQTFDIVKAIHAINEWEAIDGQNMEVSYLRLSEVCEELGMEVIDREDFKHNYQFNRFYKLVD